jgi:hypothetical protein
MFVPPELQSDPVISRLNPEIPEENRPHCPECSKPAAWFQTVTRYQGEHEPCTIPQEVVTVWLPCGHDVQLLEGTMLLHVQRPVELMGTEDDSRDRWWFGPPTAPMTI